jgi:hypothetical protein
MSPIKAFTVALCGVQIAIIPLTSLPPTTKTAIVAVLLVSVGWAILGDRTNP